MRPLRGLRAPELVTLEPRSGGGWLLAFDEPVQRRCQVRHGREVVPDAHEVVSVATLRIPPRHGDDAVSALDEWPIGSRVTVHGRVAYVEQVTPVLNMGRLAYVEVLTGRRTDAYGAGGWIVDVTLTSAPRDRWGNPTTPVVTTMSEVVVIPVSSADEAGTDEPVMSAKLIAPPGTQVPASAVVDVLSSPLAGRWYVVGDALAFPDRVEVVLAGRR